YKFVTLMMCSILLVSTPVAILADTDEAVVSEASDTSGSSSEVSEPASEPSGESDPEPASEPSSEPVAESASEPGADITPLQDPVLFAVSIPTEDIIPAQEPAVVLTPEQMLSVLMAASVVGGIPVSEPSQTPEILTQPAEPAATEPAENDSEDNETELSALGGLSALGAAPVSYDDGQRVTGNNIVDAEKFFAQGYDENLCWAATAANMLWISGYGQQAINPITDQAFQSEDEIFDYF
nr:hypothetical protein [Lachnospiraceae bacterium]